MSEVSDAEWMAQFGDLYRQNGYSTWPLDIYSGFLPFVRRSGRILELGCGNGMLLRYLMDRSGQALVPFGVDLDPLAIETANTIILPKFSRNFSLADVRIYEHGEPTFDIIVTNPVFANRAFYEQVNGRMKTLYADGSIRSFLLRCLRSLVRGGDLILYAYEEEYRRIPGFTAVIGKETAGMELQHRVSELGRAAYWLLSKQSVVCEISQRSNMTVDRLTAFGMAAWGDEVERYDRAVIGRLIAVTERLQSEYPEVAEAASFPENWKAFELAAPGAFVSAIPDIDVWLRKIMITFLRNGLVRGYARFHPGRHIKAFGEIALSCTNNLSRAPGGVLWRLGRPTVALLG